MSYIIGSMDLLESETKERLEKYAEEFDDFDSFRDNVGWESWMEEFCECEEPTEEELDKIDKILLGIFENGTKAIGR